MEGWGIVEIIKGKNKIKNIRVLEDPLSMRLQDVIEFRKDGKSKSIFMTAKLRKMNRRLRDENIRIMEKRGRPEFENDQEKVTDLNLTASQIRKKLRRDYGKK